MKKCPAESAGNGISEPLNLKKKNKTILEESADVHATSNEKINVQI